jgi:hypothetical protein
VPYQVAFAHLYKYTAPNPKVKAGPGGIRDFSQIPPGGEGLYGLSIFSRPSLEPGDKTVTTDKIGKCLKLDLTPTIEKLVNLIKAHILDGINESAIDGNPVADCLSVTSALKRTNLESLMVIVSGKIDHFIPLTIQGVNSVAKATTTLTALITKIATGPMRGTTVTTVTTPIRHKSLPDCDTLAVGIRHTFELIVRFGTHIIMRVTAAGIIGIPTVLFPKLEKLVNVVQTLITVQDRRIELKTRNGTIRLTTKLSATIQLLITLTIRSLNLDPKLALGADTFVRNE